MPAISVGGVGAQCILLILIFLQILQPKASFVDASRHADRMRLSDSCNPQCTSGTTCIERPSLCSFSNCPTYLSCIRTSTLPQHLVRPRTTSESPRPVAPTPKPGCPSRTLLEGPCITQCQQDIDCGQGQVCCPNTCGQVCRPDLRVSQVPRPGSCPRFLASPNTQCEAECQNDHDCPGMHKCCLTSCGSRACTAPCFLQYTRGRWRQPRRCRRRSSSRSHHGRRHKRKFRSQNSSSFRLRNLFL